VSSAAGGSEVSRHITKVDHVAIAVEDMAAAMPLFRDVLGGQFIAGGDNLQTGVRLIHLMFPGFKLELMQSLRDDSILAPSMRRRGPGFHHMTFFVDDVLATVDAFSAVGLETTGTDVSSPNWSETFLRPRDSFGAMLQFVSTEREWDVPTRDFELEDVLAGRVHWRDFVPCLQHGASA
jgi:methylmalonyl-CoA/ethylmalonyl-CoA epimerase